MSVRPITGTISRAYTNHDGITRVLVNASDRRVIYGTLQVRGEPLDDLAGCQVRLIDAGLWVLTKGRATA